jgi:hypothetical protein
MTFLHGTLEKVNRMPTAKNMITSWDKWLANRDEIPFFSHMLTNIAVDAK